MANEGTLCGRTLLFNLPTPGPPTYNSQGFVVFCNFSPQYELWSYGLRRFAEEQVDLPTAVKPPQVAVRLGELSRLRLSASEAYVNGGVQGVVSGNGGKSAPL